MIILFSLLGILVLGLFLWSNIKRGNYVSIINIVLIFTIIDLFIPAIIGNISGKYFSLPYVAPLTDSEVLVSVIFADISYFLLLFSYSVYRPKHNSNIKNLCYIINVKKVNIIFLFAVAIYFFNLYYEYKSFGGWLDFYTYKLTRAYAVTVEAQSEFARFVSIMSETTYVIIIMMFGIMITNKDKFTKKEFTVYFIIIVSICLFSLSRGTIIGGFISIAAAYEYNAITMQKKMSKELKQKLRRYAIIGVCSFLLFGGLRNTLQISHFDNEKTSIVDNMVEAANNTLGNSLIGLARTIRYVEAGNPLYYGQSYGEIFLSLIPRSIFPNKPQIYGVQTLSMAEDTPESTMDAITMPGEILMNFSYFGVFIMVLWGIIFKVLESFKYKFRLRYFLCASVFTISTTCCWMSFTGLFAQTKYLIIYYIVLRITIKPYKYNEILYAKN